MSVYEKAVGFNGYDEGLTDIYSDDLLPKKRGRKKKSASSDSDKPKKKKVESQIDNENTELIDALINGDEIDEALLDEAFNQYSPKIDLVCDTTGTIGKLRDQSSSGIQDATVDDIQPSSVMKWCQAMLNKDTYSDEEMDAFEVIKELCVHIGMSFGDEIVL